MSRLRRGVWLLLTHPEVAARTCADCLRYQYSDTAEGMGARVYRRDHLGRMTLPMFRLRNDPPPCHRCPKIPDGAPPVPASALDLDERGWATYSHYLGCKAVHWQTSDAADPIVKESATVILAVEQEQERSALAALGYKLDGLSSVLLAVLRAR